MSMAREELEEQEKIQRIPEAKFVSTMQVIYPAGTLNTELTA